MPSRSKGKQTSPQSPRLAWRVGQSSLIKARPRTDAPRRRSCGTSKATACARAPLQRAPAAWRAAAAGLGCYCCLPAHPCGNFSSTTFSYRGFFCFGSYTWSQRWLATIFSLQILFGLLSNYVGAWKCFDGGVGQIFLRPYVRRLRRRAIKDALDGMLDRHSRALEEERAGKSRSPGDFAVAEAYEVLQSHLSPLWEASANSRDFTSFIFFHTFLGVVFGLLYLVGSSGYCTSRPVGASRALYSAHSCFMWPPSYLPWAQPPVPTPRSVTPATSTSPHSIACGPSWRATVPSLPPPRTRSARTTPWSGPASRRRMPRG